MLHSFRGRARGGFFPGKKPVVVLVEHVKVVCWTIKLPGGRPGHHCPCLGAGHPMAMPDNGPACFEITSLGTDPAHIHNPSFGHGPAKRDIGRI